MKPQSNNHHVDSDEYAQSLNAKALRDLPEDAPMPDIPRSEIYFVLDNVYDTYNIGGLFRLADALAISRMCLCGVSETPPNSRIKKASIGTYKVVPWAYYATTEEAIIALRNEIPDIKIISVELSDASIPYNSYNYTRPVALVLGSETHGVSQAVQDMSDAIVDIPMKGFNISLNVIVSAAIVAYHAQSQLDLSQ